MNPFGRVVVAVALTGLTAAYDPAARAAPNPVPAAAERGQAAGISTADRRFLTTAAQDAMTQVHFGQLAAHKGSSAQVRDLGDRMVEGHTRAGEALNAIAGRKGVPLPADIPPVQRREYQRLAKLSGPQFDQEYVKHVRALHLRDVSEFRAKARSARDPEVRAFAQNTLPDIEEQLVLVVFAAAMTLA